ncbi:hypothetical protein LLH03_04860 [bacterium]|nr:hypothetical protein [bacterium]
MQSRLRIVLILTVLGGALAFPVATQAQTGPATVVLAPVSERQLTEPGLVSREQSARFSFGPIPYSISYRVRVDKNRNVIVPSEGYLGMPLPTSCNWYGGGFLTVTLNGQDIGMTPAGSVIVSQTGSQAILDLVWHHAIATVRVRFVGLPGRDRLYCEISFDPKQEIKSLALGLRCYPSFFTSWYKRDGARLIQTPTATIRQGEAAKLPARDQWWALYSDDVFDVAKGEGEGPCAMMYLPGQPSEVNYAPGSYAVDTTLVYPASTRQLRLAFWDLKGSTNAEALARMQAEAETTRQELEQTDFTPEVVRSFDVAALQAEVDRALASPEIRRTLGSRLSEVEAWVTRYGPALRQRDANPGIEAEETLLQSLQTYQSFIWEVRLAELLSEL